jgi:hypothetical protein
MVVQSPKSVLRSSVMAFFQKGRSTNAHEPTLTPFVPVRVLSWIVLRASFGERTLDFGHRTLDDRRHVHYIPRRSHAQEF